MSYQLQMDSCGYEVRMHYIIQRHVRLIVLVLDKERLGGGGVGDRKVQFDNDNRFYYH